MTVWLAVLVLLLLQASVNTDRPEQPLVETPDFLQGIPAFTSDSHGNDGIEIPAKRYLEEMKVLQINTSHY